MKQVKLQGYPVEIGDRVWDMWQGWGAVESLHPETSGPIRVAFAGGYRAYTEAGSFDLQGIPRLFWQPVKITPPPKPERKWIRVADLGTRYVVVDDELVEARLQKYHPNFVRWLTDRIEVEP